MPHKFVTLLTRIRLRNFTMLLLGMFMYTFGFAQISAADTSWSVREFDYFYTDSIDDTLVYGNYEPTGIVSLADGSLVISTEFSIDFPNPYYIPGNLTKEFFDRDTKTRAKSHISSGSVFKLNNRFKKEWEIVFKDKRVKAIKKLPDETLLLLGERVDMELFWMARISPDGKIQFSKDFHFKKEPNIVDVAVDSLNQVYVILACERLQWIQVNKSYRLKHRLRFFQTSSMENDIYLLKISPEGDIISKKAIDTRPHISTYGYDLLLDKNIYFRTHYSGFGKTKKKWVRQEGETVYEISPKGKILGEYPIDNKCLLYMDKQLVYTTSADNDTLVLYRYATPAPSPVDTFVLGNDITKFWITKTLSTSNNNYLLGTHYYNLGCLLIELDKKNMLNGYWTNKENDHPGSSFVDACIMPDGSIAILGERYSLPKETLPHKVNSVKIYILQKDTGGR